MYLRGCKLAGLLDYYFKRMGCMDVCMDGFGCELFGCLIKERKNMESKLWDDGFYEKIG